MTDTDAPQPPAHKRHPIARVLGIIFLILMFSVVAFFVFLPEGWLRGEAGQRGSAVLGRSFSIDGPLHVRWNWTTPHVHVENIRLGNAKGMEGDDMLNIGQLDFSIKIWQLLYGKMNFPELKITNARLLLEKDMAGQKNWDLPLFSKSQAVTTAVVPKSRHSFPVVETFVMKNSTLIYKDESKKLNIDLTLDTANGSSSGHDDAIVVTGKGTLHDKDFSLDAKGGSVAMLRNNSKPYPLTLDLQMGQTSLTVNGTFLDPVKLAGVDTTLDVKGDNMADLFYLTAIPLPPSPPYQISGTLKKDGEKWHYDGFKGKVGNSDLSGDMEYDISGARGMVTANMESNLLDMDDLSGFIGVPPSTKPGEAASAKQKAEAAERAANPRLLPDVPINLDRLRTTDMNVDMVAHKIHAPGYPLENLKAHLNLRDGLLKIDPLDIGIASGAISGSLVLDGRKDMPDVATNVVMKKLSFKDFFKDTQFASLSAGHFGGRVDLSGKGKSLAEVMGDSDGHLTLTMAGGRMSHLIIEAAGLDVAQAAPLLFDKDNSIPVRCAIGDFKVENGLLTSQIFVLDTTDTNFKGDARINLKDETIDAKLTAHPKDKSPLSLRTPITISGRLKKPSIGIDPTQAGERAGAAAVLSTILTPLAAILPFIDLGLGKDSDCHALIAEAQAHAKEDKPTQPNLSP